MLGRGQPQGLVRVQPVASTLAPALGPRSEGPRTARRRPGALAWSALPLPLLLLERVPRRTALDRRVPLLLLVLLRVRVQRQTACHRQAVAAAAAAAAELPAAAGLRVRCQGPAARAVRQPPQRHQRPSSLSHPPPQLLPVLPVLLLLHEALP